MTYKEYTGNRDELIKMYIPFTYRVANNYRYLAYNNLSGLEGEALLALCEAIDMIIATPTKWNIHIASIVAVTISRKLREYANKDKVIFKGRRQHYTGLVRCPERIVSDEVYPALPQCEMHEIIEDMQLTPRQETIVTMLLANYEPSEIIKSLGISRSYYFQLKKIIQNKIKGKANEKD